MDQDKDCCPVTSGGSTTTTNGDEGVTLERTTQGLPVRAEGMQEPGRH